MNTVKDIVRGQVLRTIAPDHPIHEAYARMEDNKVHSLLVFEGEEFRGIITMTDVASSLYGQSGGTVGDVMTPVEKVITVGFDEITEGCRFLMVKNHVHHLVATDESGKVVGVVSSLDL